MTHETPTPWRPAETLYDSLENLPPAWSTVITTSAALLPCSTFHSTGMPRPSSETVTEPSRLMETWTAFAKPASASSTLLSTTS